MNPILLILALLFLIPIFKEFRIYALIKWHSKQVVGQIISVEKKEVFTTTLTSILLGGKTKLVKMSYKFTLDNKEFQVLNDEVAVSPSSNLNKLKKDDNIDIYVYSNKNNEIKDTWVIKNSLIKLFPFLLLFLLLLIVAYSSSDM